MQLSQPALILDNGGHSIKATFTTPTIPSSSADPPPFVFASLSLAPRRLADHLLASGRISIYRNAIIRSKTEKKTYVADEWDACKDFGGLTFRVPMERVSGGFFPLSLSCYADPFQSEEWALWWRFSCGRAYLMSPSQRMPRLRSWTVDQGFRDAF